MVREPSLFCLIQSPRDPRNVSGEIHQARHPIQMPGPESTTTGSGSTFTDQHHTAAVRIQQVRRHGVFFDLHCLVPAFARVFLS